MEMKSILKWAIGGAIVGLTATILLTSPVRASECGNAQQAQALVDQYGEQILVSYKDEKNNVIMIYGNIDTGTTTVFMSPIGKDRFCIISSGVNMMIGAPPKKSKAPGKDGA